MGLDRMRSEHRMLDGAEVAAAPAGGRAGSQVRHRGRVDAHVLEALGQRRRTIRARPLGKPVLERLGVREAAGQRSQLRGDGPVRRAERLDEALPVLVVVDRNGDPALAAVLVGAAEDAVRRGMP